MSTVNLLDVASVIRSKNAGPFLITLDVIFNEPKAYEASKRSAAFTPEGIASLYGLDNHHEIQIFFLDAADAVKVTLPSRHPSGDFRCSDVYGAQQYLPLVDIELELSTVQEAP